MSQEMITFQVKIRIGELVVEIAALRADNEALRTQLAAQTLSTKPSSHVE